MIFKQISRPEYKTHLIEIDAYEDQSLDKIPKNPGIQEKQEELEKWIKE